LKDAVDLPGAARILLAEAEQQVLLRDVLDSHLDQGEILLAIGPEGGWADDEVQLFKSASWISASLGSTILRAETAAIAATAIVISELS
jgi:16S rRNA (uracil1498-N3)-methyltransferase